MIIICEPQCKGFSHEKINSGFIFALRLAFPDEKIVLFAHSSHINCLMSIIKHDNITINNIEYISIEYDTLYGYIGMFYYTILLNKLFKYARKNNVYQLFFLSFSAPILYIIKKLKKLSKYVSLKFVFVLHGEFENINTEVKAKKYLLESSLISENKFKKILSIDLKTLPKKLISLINANKEKYFTYRKNEFYNKFPIKDTLINEHSKDYRYIALAPHIIKNAQKYINVKHLNISTVFFPTIFSPITKRHQNNYVKFAVFGYGNSYMLNQILKLLSTKKITNQYEIRIISMDTRGTVGFPNVTCPSRGKQLIRSEMENYAYDIDMFLILYDNDSYRLSCSNAIIEALSYSKPVVNFKNDCIDFFNNPDHPIGISCNNIEDYINTLVSLINDFNSFKPQLKLFNDNILKLRDELSIYNSVDTLRKNLEW
jgi:hypothetical protein